MAYVQKFKFLATQCAAIGTPTRSPTTSPVVHIRRRKTLRMLLGKTSNSNFQRRFLDNYHHNRDNISNSKSTDNKNLSNNSSKSVGVRSKLKDLFVSSPEEERLLPEKGNGSEGVEHGGVVVEKRGGHGGGVRPLSATLRQRLLMRRNWRPALVAIPEVSP